MERERERETENAAVCIGRKSASSLFFSPVFPFELIRRYKRRRKRTAHSHEARKEAAHSPDVISLQPIARGCAGNGARAATVSWAGSCTRGPAVLLEARRQRARPLVAGRVAGRTLGGAEGAQRCRRRALELVAPDAELLQTGEAGDSRRENLHDPKEEHEGKAGVKANIRDRRNASRRTMRGASRCKGRSTCRQHCKAPLPTCVCVVVVVGGGDTFSGYVVAFDVKVVEVHERAERERQGARHVVEGQRQDLDVPVGVVAGRTIVYIDLVGVRVLCVCVCARGSEGRRRRRGHKAQ